jgi:hypothetical protein
MIAVVEIRNRLLERLRYTVWRPMMGAGNIDATETLLLHLLDTLCFIDGREEEWATAGSTYLTGCRGVRGHFEFQHRPFPDFVNEVASVYAEVAFSLGYYRPAHLLSEEAMARVNATVERGEFRSRDWTEAELHSEFGPPSHEVVGGLTTVACYACEAPAVKWVFFDLARGFSWSGDWLPVPLVRDFRTGHYNQMHLLPVGQRLAEGETSPAFTRPAEFAATPTPAAGRVSGDS